MKQKKSNGKRKQLHSTNLDLGQSYSSKNFFKLIRQNGGFETKLQALESPDSDKRAGRKTRTKIDLRSRSRNKSDEKETKND